MGLEINMITMGYYKNCNIILKEENPVLIYKTFWRKTEVPLDKTTIKTINYSGCSDGKHEIIIEWKDGMLSQAFIDDNLCSAIFKMIS